MKNAFTSKEQYMKFRDAFKKIAHKKGTTGMHMVFLNLARGKDPFFGFTPITNPKKLASTPYQSPWYNVNSHFYELRDTVKAESVYYKAQLEKLKFELENTIPEESWAYIAQKISETKGK